MSNITDATPSFNVGGLASGLDTNTIITQLMSIERQPQVRLSHRQTIEAARQQTLRDVNTRLLNLQTAITGLRDVATWGDQQTVESSDPTHLTATRTGGAAAGGYQVGITQLARAQQLTQSTAATAASADGTLTITVGSGTAVDVAVVAGDSLQTVADKINGSSGSQAYASVVSGKLVLSGKLTGAASTIDVSGGAAADFGFAETQSALDANYTLDGVPKTSSSNLVTDGMAGVTLNLKGVTSSPVSITVAAPGPDSSAVKSKVQAFIDQYNSTIDFIRGKLDEKPVLNPTNDSDRSKGTLHGDSGLEDLLANLRSAIATPVAGRPSITSMLSQVGVSTGAAVGSGTLNHDSIVGKLTLDATRLDDQLADHFSDVKALFTNATGVYSTEGLAQRLDGFVSTMVNATTGVLTGRIASEQTMIDGLKQQSADMDVRLTAKEAALRARFTAMETALSHAQSQGSYLTSQISALGA
jgi:flagellar hook-associated protein 2